MKKQWNIEMKKTVEIRKKKKGILSVVYDSIKISHWP